MKKIFNIVIVLIVVSPLNTFCGKKTSFKEVRENMVQNQIIQRGIKDPKVIEVLRKIPRHIFLPKRLWNSAYEDRPMPIGENQTISQPYIVAFMTEAIKLKPDEKVLEIGTGSGYQAAVLAEIAKEVYTIEIIELLGKRAENALKFLGYKNVKVKIGDGYKGWEEHAPYDAIIVTCAPDHIPQPLIDQLKEGGRMIIPVGDYFNQQLVFVEKVNGKIQKKSVLPVIFVPMTGEGVKTKK